MDIGYIGSSPISEFHIQALKKNGFKISAIGTTKNSQACKVIAEKYGLIDQYCHNGWEEVIDYDLDAYVICVNVKFTLRILEKALETGKPIFVEKPINYEYEPLEKIRNHRNIKNIFVGYNRRYYKTTNELKNFCDSSKGGTILVNIPDSKSGIQNFISNGCHMIDLLRYLIGEFEVLKKIINIDDEKKDMNYFSSLCKNEKWTISINAHSMIPSNFSISVNSDKKVFELKPIEKLSIYEGMEIIEPTSEEPLRKYLPKLKYSFVEISEFKPGFDAMHENFKLFIKGKDSNYCSFADALNTLEYCWKFIESDISANFEFI